MAALDMSPISPINNLGNNTSPIGNNLRGSVPMRPKLRDAFGGLDTDKISKGRLMTEGSYGKSFGGDRYSGLKGQLEKLKETGRHTVTKNLSKTNIRQMHDLIADRLKKQSISAQTYITKRDKLVIMQEARKLAQTKGSKFTLQDRKDLKKTVDTLQQQYKDKILNKGDNFNNPIVNKPSIVPDRNNFY